MSDNELKIRVTAELDQVEKISDKFKVLATATKDADYQFRQGKISADQLKATLAAVQREGNSLNGTYKQMVDLNATVYQVQQRASVGFKSLAVSIDDLNKTMRATNPAFTSFNQVIQDAPFGIRGVGNNIQFMTQQFTQLRSAGMSTGDVLKGIVQNALTPMGGLMLAVSAGTSLLTVAMDMLGSKTEATAKKTKSMNDLLLEQSDTMYQLGEITRNQRISDLEMKIAEYQVALEKISVSQYDFRATVLARAKDPNTKAVYTTIGTPQEIREITKLLTDAQLALKRFIEESEPKTNTPKPSRSKFGGIYGYQPFDNGQNKALFNIDQRRQQLEDEGKKYQMQQAEELAQIREDAERRSLKKTEDNLRSAMNLYNSVFFSPLKAGFEAIASGSGNMADAFIDSLKRMIVQLLEFAAFSMILSFIPGMGTFTSLFSTMSGLTSLATPVTTGGTSNRSTLSRISSRSMNRGGGLKVQVVGKLGNDAIYLSGNRYLSMNNAAKY